MTFPEIDAAAQSPVGQTRMKRQLAEQAIAQATAAEWGDAAETNRRLLELGADSEAENRLAKALEVVSQQGRRDEATLFTRALSESVPRLAVTRVCAAIRRGNTHRPPVTIL